MPLTNDEIELGYISGVFGVRGEVRLFLHNPESDLLDDPREVTLVRADGGRERGLVSARPGSGRRIIGRIAGVDDPDAARGRIGWRLVIRKEELPALEDDEYYHWQVEGMPVVVGGAVVGKVLSVQRTEGGDVLEVRIGTDTAFVRMDPMLVDLDLEEGQVHVAPEALDEDAR